MPHGKGYEEMENAVAEKAYGKESPIEVEIKVCADSWEELRKRLPLLFK
jgi:hypothetical protein